MVTFIIFFFSNIEAFNFCNDGRTLFKHGSDCVAHPFLLVQWLVTGGRGCRGASAVRPAVKEYSPGYDCATALRLRSMGLSARARTPKRKCARREPVPVRIPGTHFKLDPDKFECTSVPSVDLKNTCCSK